jgi:hypothetical protein
MNSSQIIAESVFQPSQFANLGNSAAQVAATSAIPTVAATTAVSQTASSIPWGKILFWAVIAAIVLYAASELWEHYQQKQGKQAAI